MSLALGRFTESYCNNQEGEEGDQKLWKSSYWKLPLRLEIVLEDILSVSVLEWEISRIGCKMHGTNELEEKESTNSLLVL